MTFEQAAALPTIAARLAADPTYEERLRAFLRNLNACRKERDR